MRCVTSVCADSGRPQAQLTRAVLAVLVPLLGSACHDTSAAAVPAVVTAQMACANLSGKHIGGATLSSAVIPAKDSVPTYCKVNGTIPPALKFEMRLPNAWNGKLYYGGGGGYNGSIPALVVPALLQGYAQVASDSGHQGDGMSAAFVLNDTFAAQLYGSLAVPTVMSTAVKIVTSVYAAAPIKSYFEGCSNGGREALMAVQRNPGLFDGVIARAPAYNTVGFVGAFNQTARALAAPGGAFSAAKTALLAKHVREACDGLDGIVDGVVSNPTACSTSVVNVAALRCPGGRDSGDTCLSDAQLAVVKSWTSDAVYEGGNFRSRGYNLTGNEDDRMGFGPWVSGNGDVRTAGQYVFQDTSYKFYIARDPKADSLAYTPWDKNQNALYALAALNDATQTDIRAFIGNGGKLIVWHGGSDVVLSVNSTIDYMKGMRNAVGEGNASAATRFYVAPGVDHCEGGPGADKSDLLKALDEWATKGVAPATLTAQKLDANGSVARTLPLCQYPQYPRYTGPANDAPAARLATSYTCTTP